MKNILLPLLIFCLLLSGCGSLSPSAIAEVTPTQPTITPAPAPEATEAADPSENSEAPAVIYPLPDTTMDNLQDAILSVSLNEGDAYVDDTGIMQMDLTIYSYDKYDMVDITALKVGDILVTGTGDVVVFTLDRSESGSVLINGGLYEDGFDLVTDDCGIYYERGYNDAKNWHEVGEATIRVSADFEYHDTSNLELGEVLYYPGSFLIGEVTDYHFTPDNTTIRVESGQIVEMHRVYVP